jgi:uncharacterized protein YheU (UPF0270 family)
MQPITRLQKVVVPKVQQQPVQQPLPVAHLADLIAGRQKPRVKIRGQGVEGKLHGAPEGADGEEAEPLIMKMRSVARQAQLGAEVLETEEEAEAVGAVMKTRILRRGNDSGQAFHSKEMFQNPRKTNQ